MGEPSDYLDPATLTQLDKLEWIAQRIVEGFLRGHHPGSKKGSSIEFAEHRAYVPGDEIRRIDWRTYARSDRHYVREYEDETNLRASLLIDTSRSMGFSSRGISKLKYGTALAAALGFLLVQQHDAVGLITFDSKLREFIRPKATGENLYAIFDRMEKLEASGVTGMRDALAEVAERVNRRSLVIALSDWLDDVEESLEGLSRLRHRECEVVVFHLLDPAEVSLPFDGWTVFRDSERPRAELRLDTRQMRSLYSEALESHCRALRRGCEAAEIDYIRLETDEPFHIPLSSYLHSRSQRRR